MSDIQIINGFVKPGQRISVLKLAKLDLNAGTARFEHDGISYYVERRSNKGSRKAFWYVTDEYETL